jgi:hypothetical protein
LRAINRANAFHASLEAPSIKSLPGFSFNFRIENQDLLSAADKDHEQMKELKFAGWVQLEAMNRLWQDCHPSRIRCEEFISLREELNATRRFIARPHYPVDRIWKF